MFYFFYKVVCHELRLVRISRGECILITLTKDCIKIYKHFNIVKWSFSLKKYFFSNWITKIHTVGRSYPKSQSQAYQQVLKNTAQCLQYNEQRLGDLYQTFVSVKLNPKFYGNPCISFWDTDIVEIVKNCTWHLLGYVYQKLIRTNLHPWLKESEVWGKFIQ